MSLTGAVPACVSDQFEAEFREIPALKISVKPQNSESPRQSCRFAWHDYLHNLIYW